MSEGVSQIVVLKNYFQLRVFQLKTLYNLWADECTLLINYS